MVSDGPAAAKNDRLVVPVSEFLPKDTLAYVSVPDADMLHDLLKITGEDRAALATPEAALKEMPALTKGLLFIKVTAAVAPLMGLLGTVTGMIKTFQVITLYGAGDPKMMAGGISQALMTTVLGLCVAIPMVLLHTVVSGKSRKIVNILQSQSAGLVAQHSERSS